MIDPEVVTSIAAQSNGSEHETIKPQSGRALWVSEVGQSVVPTASCSEFRQLGPLSRRALHQLGLFHAFRTPHDSKSHKGAARKETTSNGRCDPHPRKGYTFQICTSSDHGSQSIGYTAITGSQSGMCDERWGSGSLGRYPETGEGTVKAVRIIHRDVLVDRCSDRVGIALSRKWRCS